MPDDSMTEQNGEITPAGPPEMSMVYANVAGVRGGAFDLSLEFGFAIPPGEGEAPQPPAWKVRIAMSWEHARALHGLLGANLAHYEKTVGQIPNIDKLRLKEG